MKNFILIALMGIGLWQTVRGGRKRRWLRMISGLLLIAATVFIFWFFDFWAELLWFEALGYA